MILGQRLVVAGLVVAFTRNVPESERPLHYSGLAQQYFALLGA